MTKQKNFDDVADILSEQMDILKSPKVTQEQRKNAQVMSRIVGCYISLSVHKAEYDKNDGTGAKKIPAFERRLAK